MHYFRHVHLLYFQMMNIMIDLLRRQSRSTTGASKFVLCNVCAFGGPCHLDIHFILN